MDESIRMLAEGILQLQQEAYEIYIPITNDLCSRVADQDEVEQVLDYMLAFCGSEDVLRLFKRICRRYLHIYPECITQEIYAYKDLYDSDEENDNE